jgi:hypothetical protein
VIVSLGTASNSTKITSETQAKYQGCTGSEQEGWIQCYQSTPTRLNSKTTHRTRAVRPLGSALKSCNDSRAFGMMTVADGSQRGPARLVIKPLSSSCPSHPTGPDPVPDLGPVPTGCCRPEPVPTGRRRSAHQQSDHFQRQEQQRRCCWLQQWRQCQ